MVPRLSKHARAQLLISGPSITPGRLSSLHRWVPGWCGVSLGSTVPVPSLQDRNAHPQCMGSVTNRKTGCGVSLHGCPMSQVSHCALDQGSGGAQCPSAPSLALARVPWFPLKPGKWHCGRPLASTQTTANLFVLK